MPRNQWLLAAGLALVVSILLFLMGFAAFKRLTQHPAQNAALMVAATEPPARAAATALPTATDIATPSATLVIGDDQTRLVVVPPTPTGLFHTFDLGSLDLYTMPTSVPTRTRVPGPISDAWARMDRVKSTRMELSMSMHGNFGSTALPGMNIAPDANGQMMLLSMTAATNGKDSDLSLKGFIAAIFGGDPTQGMEMMTVGDKLYVLGPASLFGAPEAKWYVGPNSGKPASSSSLKPADMVNSLGGGNSDWSGFDKSSSEVFDGKSCDVYSANTDTSLRLFQSLNTKQLTTLDPLRGLTSADARIWICEDGYVHQMRLSLEGAAPDKPDQKFGLDISMHMYDQGLDIAITPPKEAAPLEMPGWLSFPTPTHRPPTAVK